MNSAEQTGWVCEQARALGFDLCGVAPATKFSELDHLPEWHACGYAGEMKYLGDARRGDPRLVLSGARSLIVVALNYNTAHPRSTQAFSTQLPTEKECPRGWISRYAWGDDYHEVLLIKLKSLIARMRAHFSEPFEARPYVDTGPIVERVAAKYAGLGWLAKNTSLINQQMGSWLFLGVIITSLALEPSVAPDAPPTDLCGTCTRCLDACPTHAFPEPYVLDARRCISYLTIELRGDIPEELRAQMGSAVIGCDICQDVCPWNRKAPVTSLAAFQPRQRTSEDSISEKRPCEPRPEDSQCEYVPPGISLLLPELESLARLSQEEFSALFRGSAVKRAKFRSLVRNACVALGNSRTAPDSAAYAGVIQTLERLASSPDPLISNHARWALKRLSISDPETVCADSSSSGGAKRQAPAILRL